MRIARADPTSDAAEALIAAHHAHGAAHYPADSNHEMNGATLVASNARFFVAFGNDDAALGMAAFVPQAHDPRGVEVKSVFVYEAARGRGVSKALMQATLDAACGEGFATAQLETGSRDASAAARGLYEGFGFAYCAPFPPYVQDPESVFMTVDLEALIK